MHPEHHLLIFAFLHLSIQLMALGLHLMVLFTLPACIALSIFIQKVSPWRQLGRWSAQPNKCQDAPFPSSAHQNGSYQPHVELPLFTQTAQHWRTFPKKEAKTSSLHKSSKNNLDLGCHLLSKPALFLWEDIQDLQATNLHYLLSFQVWGKKVSARQLS